MRVVATQEDHQVEGEDSEVGLVVAALFGARMEVVFEESLELREGAFGLPALAVAGSGEVIVHASPMPRFGWTAVATRVDGNNGLSRAQQAARQDVKGLGIISSVAHEGLNAQPSRRLSDQERTFGRIVGGPSTHRRRSDQVGFVMSQDTELYVGQGAFYAPIPAFQEVPADVARLESGRVHGTAVSPAEPAAAPSAVENLIHEPFEAPFFSRRCSAF